MINLILWLALATAGLIHVLVTRATVWMIGKGADNAWDNALGYLVVTCALSWPIRWVWETPSWLLIALLPALSAVALVSAVRLIYQVGAGRASAIAAIQLTVTSGALALLTLVVGIVAAYIMYGRIISDPVRLLRIVLRLIGIEPPF